jgi:hypothetical protein
MPRSVSAAFRRSLSAQQADEDGVTLITITNPNTDVVTRLASHALQQLSYDPLTYGVRSRGLDFSFVLMETAFPDDEEGVPPSTQIICENVAAGLSDPLRDLVDPLQFSLEMVRQSDPDVVEFDEPNLEGSASTISAERIVLNVSTDLFTTESFPYYHMTKNVTPGLFP